MAKEQKKQEKVDGISIAEKQEDVILDITEYIEKEMFKVVEKKKFAIAGLTAADTAELKDGLCELLLLMIDDTGK